MNCALTSALNSDSIQEMKAMYLWAPFHFKGWRDRREKKYIFFFFCGGEKIEEVMVVKKNN